MENQAADPEEEAAKFLNPEMEVPTTVEALAGARDIIAERVADDAPLRGRVRKIYEEDATVSSKIMYGKEEEADAQKFRDYFEWSEPLKTIPSHRILAIRRGEKEGFLLMRVEVPLDRVTRHALPDWVKSTGPAGKHVAQAVEDGCKRLLMPSMETEARLMAKKRADETAITVFAENFRELLLASPLGEKRLLAIDPGFRTGCKTVVLDRSGKLLHHTVLHCTAGSQNQAYEAAVEVTTLIKKHDIEAIAIGNGTASRETEAFIKKLKLPSSIPVVMVNESGASIYSASDVAREEFPNEDVTVRGAVIHRPPPDGPARRAGEDRRQSHRRRPIPARRRSTRAQGQPRRHRRELPSTPWASKSTPPPNNSSPTSPASMPRSPKTSSPGAMKTVPSPRASN